MKLIPAARNGTPPSRREPEPGPTKRQLLAGVALLSLLLCACGGKSQPPAATPVATAADASPSSLAKPAPRIVIGFDPSITDGDRALVRDVSDTARAYYVAQTGHDLLADIHIAVLPMTPRRAVGITDGDQITIFAGNEGWSLTDNDARSHLDKSQIVAHEVFHTFQAALVGKRHLLATDGAPWVIEGSAEYAAYSYLVDSGLTTWAAVHKDTDPFLSHRLAPAAGTASGTGEFYPVAFLAVEKLVGSGGLHLLGQFFVDSGQMDWRDAFKKDFGQDAIAYINAFEAARPP